MRLKVEIRRESDGEVRIHEDDDDVKIPAGFDEEDFSATLFYLWDEGNWSCDCNRGQFWHEANGTFSEHDHRDCSDGKYTVRMTCNGETIIDEWNVNLDPLDYDIPPPEPDGD